MLVLGQDSEDCLALVMRISGVFSSVPGSSTALVCNHPPMTAALHKPVYTLDMTSRGIGLAKAPQTGMAVRCFFSEETIKATTVNS